MSRFSFAQFTSFFPSEMIQARLAIDLGSSRTRIWQVGKGLLLDEPTCIAVEKKKDLVLAIGTEAQEMLGRAKAGVEVIFPVQHGICEQPTAVQNFLKQCVSRVFKSSIFLRPEIVLSVPSNASELEREALTQMLVRSGLGEVNVVPQLLAAAIGAGVPVADVSGSVLCVLGGGLLEVGIISLGSLVKKQSKSWGGVDIALHVQHIIQRHAKIHVSYRGAEQALQQVASLEAASQRKLTICGQDISSRVPRETLIGAMVLQPAVTEVVDSLLQLFQALLESVPAELSADIVDKGVLLAGGLSKLDGLEHNLAERLGIPVATVDQPDLAVIRGLAQVAEHLADFRESIAYEH